MATTGLSEDANVTQYLCPGVDRESRPIFVTLINIKTAYCHELWQARAPAGIPFSGFASPSVPPRSL